MTFDEAIERTLHTLGHSEMATRVIIILQELRKIYAKPVEMTIEQKCYLVASKNGGESFYQMESYQHYEFSGFVFRGVSEQDLMRAWLHPELIKVVE